MTTLALQEVAGAGRGVGGHGLQGDVTASIKNGPGWETGAVVVKPARRSYYLCGGLLMYSAALRSPSSRICLVSSSRVAAGSMGTAVSMQKVEM